MERIGATRSVVWAGAAQSNELDIRYFGAAGVYVDSNFAGSALTVQVNIAGEGEPASWKDLYDADGAAVSVTPTADKVTALPITLFGFPKIRLVSDESETATGKVFAMS